MRTMKLRQHQFSTQVQTSELKKPNSPTKKDIAKARFKDKTYHAPVRSGDNASKSRGR